MTIPEYLLGIAVVSVFLVLWLRDRKRTTDIKSIASSYKFHYLDTALPRSLTLIGTPVAHASKTWNVIDGERNGIRVIAFDCQIGEGKRSYRQTIIAAQTSLDIFGKAQFDHSPTVGRSGKWVILYQPKTHFLDSIGLMPISELEAYIDAIRATP